MQPTTPVQDWSTDFELFDPGFRADPFPVYAQLRVEPGLAHTERWEGQWLPTRYDDIAAIAHDSDHFSSESPAVTGPKPGGPQKLMHSPPITSDPPAHSADRRLLLPAFSPQAIERLIPFTREVARSCMRDILERGDGTADAAKEYAQHLPVRVIATMLGIPLEDEEQFVDWVVRILQVGTYDFQVARSANRELLEYMAGHVEARRNDPSPPDDLITYLTTVRRDDGSLLDQRHVLGACWLLLVAGIDTTWSSLGSALWHLATHPEDRERLVADPSLLPTAIEEFLRAYSPVTMARIVTDDVTVAGSTLHKGDRVLLPFPAGNRDPEVFERPEEVLIDRQVNRHAAFGLGVHRCLGSNLARMELRIGVEEWLAAIPTFRLVPGAEVEWTGGQVRGPRTVPVTYPA